MAHAQNLFNISASDRLGLTLFFAIALHAIVILGVGFDFEQLLPKEPPLTLEITLVHSQSEKAPDNPDYLAQANQQGGGNMEEKVRPSSPFPNPRPTLEQDGSAAQTLPMQLPPPSQANDEQTVLLAQTDSTQRWHSSEKEINPELPETPNPQELMANSIEIARTMAALEEKQQAYAKKPRERYVAANTSESVYAAYIDSWSQKVERIGTLNYPTSAKSQNLSGKLLLDVAINPDGSVHSIVLDRSSGHRELDNAAIETVKMAANFAPLPPEILKEVDVLHIVRTWSWEISDGFSLNTH